MFDSSTFFLLIFIHSVIFNCIPQSFPSIVWFICFRYHFEPSHRVHFSSFLHWMLLWTLLILFQLKLIECLIKRWKMLFKISWEVAKAVKRSILIFQVNAMHKTTLACIMNKSSIKFSTYLNLRATHVKLQSDHCARHVVLILIALKIACTFNAVWKGFHLKIIILSIDFDMLVFPIVKEGFMSIKMRHCFASSLRSKLNALNPIGRCWMSEREANHARLMVLLQFQNKK